MGMGHVQLGVVNSWIRQLFQRHYEFRKLNKYLEEHQIDLTGKVILDAGCGAGYSTELIMERFRPKELYAFDLMPEQVERAKQRGIAADIFVGDIASTGFPSAKFDAVFTFGVFHHVPNWLEGLEEVSRVLKPGGVLLGGELGGKDATGFEWEAFAQEMGTVGLRMVEKEKIYFGFFNSFMCVKQDR